MEGIISDTILNLKKFSGKETTKHMTLKQDTLVKNILSKDNLGRPLSEIAVDSGYARGSRQIYRKGTKQHIIKALEKEGISRDSITSVLATLGHQAQEKGDISNSLRAVEDIAKLHNLLRDQSTSITINQANVLDSIRAVDRAEVSPVDSGTVLDAENVSRV
jgi:hypothetical protein